MSHQTASHLVIIDGKEVPAASLTTIDFCRLEVKEPSEISRLFQSCETHGFFYLDLQNSADVLKVLASQKEVLRVMTEYFAQPLEVKMKDVRGTVKCGCVVFHGHIEIMQAHNYIS